MHDVCVCTLMQALIKLLNLYLYVDPSKSLYSTSDFQPPVNKMFILLKVFKFPNVTLIPYFEK